MSAPADDAPRIGNRYRLEQRIGAGAMGVVWRGTDELLDRTVAVKELLAVPSRHEQRRRSSRSRASGILREGRIGARLQHPHVISMFDVVVARRPAVAGHGVPAVRVAGGMLTREGPLRPREVAEIGRQVADGLAAAHAAGVVHRDVKPGNVLIADDGRVKLTDFGVSRAVDDVQLTRTGLIAGTPAFLAAGGRAGPAARPPRRTSSRSAPRSTPRSRARRRSGSTTTPTRCCTRSPRAPWTRRTRPARSPRCSCGCSSDDPTAAPDGVAGPRRARRHRRGPGARGRDAVDRDGPARHGTAVAAAGAGCAAVADPSPEPVGHRRGTALRHRPRRSGRGAGARRRRRRLGGRSSPSAR